MSLETTGALGRVHSRNNRRDNSKSNHSVDLENLETSLLMGYCIRKIPMRMGPTAQPSSGCVTKKPKPV